MCVYGVCVYGVCVCVCGGRGCALLGLSTYLLAITGEGDTGLLALSFSKTGAWLEFAIR